MVVRLFSRKMQKAVVAAVSQPFGYDTGCGTAASEAPDRAEIGPEFQNWSSRVRRPVALSVETTDSLSS